MNRHLPGAMRLEAEAARQKEAEKKKPAMTLRPSF